MRLCPRRSRGEDHRAISAISHGQRWSITGTLGPPAPLVGAFSSMDRSDSQADSSGLQFSIVRHRAGRTAKRRWFRLNRSELPRPELLIRLGPSEIVAGAVTANSNTQPRWEPSWEPPRRTTSPARRTSTDNRLAIMPGRELIRTMLNAMQVITDQKAGVRDACERAPPERVTRLC
jgi:hypothetical protein